MTVSEWLAVSTSSTQCEASLGSIVATTFVSVGIMCGSEGASFFFFFLLFRPVRRRVLLVAASAAAPPAWHTLQRAVWGGAHVHAAIPPMAAWLADTRAHARGGGGGGGALLTRFVVAQLRQQHLLLLLEATGHVVQRAQRLRRRALRGVGRQVAPHLTV
jgi:hypothetical protein